MKDDELIEEEITKIIEELCVKASSMMPMTTHMPSVAKEIIDLVRGSEWVSVEDELPDDDRFLMMVCNAGEDLFSLARYYNGEWKDNMSRNILTDTTHWQSLPSPPTNKGE